jgi:glutathione synthase/RimK-type ligase-like ATP-grasp enzyme
MILIITGLAADATVTRLSKVLQAYDAEHLIIAASTMEKMAALSVSGAAQDTCSILRLNERSIDLREVQSAWLWRTWSRDPYEPGLSLLAKKEREWSFFQGEWTAFCKGLSLLLAYSGAFCVNPPPFNHAFEEKCCQMMLAAQVGLCIPPTLYTAALPLARAFYDQHAGAIIYKPFRSYMRVVEEDGQPARVHKLYTNRVQAGQLFETDQYIPTPGIFQPYVEKQIELRIVVIGRNLFACAIHSQQSARSREDWRRYDLDNTPYEPYDLPPEIAHKILAFMDRVGLVFGSIDMIVTPEGEHVFLELNPNGQFDWIAQRAGLPLYQNLAAMLCAGRVDYPVLVGDMVAS